MKRIFFLIACGYIGFQGFTYHLTQAGLNHGGVSGAWYLLCLGDLLLVGASLVKLFGPDEVMHRLHAESEDIDISGIVNLVSDNHYYPVMILYAAAHFVIHAIDVMNSDYLGTLWAGGLGVADVVVGGLAYLLFDGYKKRMAKLAASPQNKPRAVA
jgi:hypothetical protein